MISTNKNGKDPWAFEKEKGNDGTDDKYGCCNGVVYRYMKRFRRCIGEKAHSHRLNKLENICAGMFRIDVGEEKGKQTH